MSESSTDGRSRGFTASSVPDGYDRFMLAQIFEPWARDLLQRAHPRPGQRVLDVASGLGPVARLVAAAIGPGGLVVASDISGPMLVRAAAKGSEPGWAPIEYRECSASALEAADDSFDVVLCQQGLQFFPDRHGALVEMLRVTRPSGQVALSVWAAEHPLGLFGPVAETLYELGLKEPYPGAFNPESYTVRRSDLSAALTDAGWRDVEVETASIDAIWSSMDEAVSALLGTPFGPQVSALPHDEQVHLSAVLASKLAQSTDGVIMVRTTCHIARASK
jgi:ubiquinone/menaquinone biosynthesis C-methylase UbiE